MSRVTSMIVVSFIVAFMLTAIPLPDWAVAWRPAWVALVMGYWCLALPQRVGVFVGWCIGLLLDVLHGSLLGQHALGLATVAFVITTYHQQIRVYPLFRQALVMGSIVFTYSVLMLLIYNFLGSKQYGSDYLLAALTSALLWPWIFVVLRDFRRKTTIA